MNYDPQSQQLTFDFTQRDVLILTEDEYLSLNGATFNFGDPALHKNRGSNSEKTWAKLVNHQAGKDQSLYERRQQLRAEYQEKVRTGHMREPTRLERLEKIAQGHPDNVQVQAAKRLIEKYKERIAKDQSSN